MPPLLTHASTAHTCPSLLTHTHTLSPHTQFDETMIVYDACRLIRERVPDAASGQRESLYNLCPYVTCVLMIPLVLRPHTTILRGHPMSKHCLFFSTYLYKRLISVLKALDANDVN